MKEKRDKKKKLLSTKGGHRCAEEKACIGFFRVHMCMKSHTCKRTRAHTMLPLRFNTGADPSQ